MKIEDETAKQFLDNILASMDEGLFTTDRDARITAFNRAAEKITGFKKEEVLQKKCHTVLKGSLCRGACRQMKTLETGESMFNAEATITNKAGTEIPVDITTSPLRSKDNEIIGLLEIITDLTEHKRLWQTLKVQRDKAQQYLSIARVMIVALDHRGRISLVNKMGCEVLGYKEEEILGNCWFDCYVPEEVRSETRTAFHELVSGKHRARVCYENRILTSSGEERIIEWHDTVLTNKLGDIIGTLSSGEDVTDRKRTEVELIRSEKLASLGQLAAAVAHEVNNPLAGILVYIHLLLKKYKQGKLQTEETEIQLEKIGREVERCSRIIKNLLDFSRQSKVTMRAVDINEVITATLEIIGHQISLEDISTQMELCPTIPAVRADFDQIQQALMNIMLNAAQAMPEGGDLTISTSIVAAANVGGSTREAVRIDISDTGVGIPEEHMERLFTPFFTTKEKGQGVGLGLSVVHGIIERHQGRMEVESCPGAGTTVSIYLGVIDEDES